jgi:hypothetical protein
MKEILVFFPTRTAVTATVIFLFAAAVTGCRVGGDDTQTAPAKVDGKPVAGAALIAPTR